MSLAHALSKAGLAPAPTSSTTTLATPTSAAEPCGDAVGRDLSAMIALLGETRALRLLDEQARAPYGKDRRASAIVGALQAARDRLPRSKAREIADVHPPTGRASDQQDWLDERVEALQGGGYAAWKKAQDQEERAVAAAPTFPELGDEEPEEEYRARVEAWADPLPVGVLRRLCPASYGSDPDVAGAIRQRLAARSAAQEERRQAALEREGEAALATLRALIASGASLEALLRAKEEIPWSSPAHRQGLAEVAASPQAWAAAAIVDVGHTPEGDPPQGWAALDLAAVAHWAIGPRNSYGYRQPVPGALVELRRRIGDGGTVPHPDGVLGERAGTLWVRFDGLALVAGANVPGRISAEVGPQGWAEPTSDGTYRWCGPAVYAALTRVLDRARTPGTLDVSRVLGAYQRHPEKRYPCLWWSVWGRSHVGVAVDDALGQALDDLACVAAHCPARVPREAFWIHGEVVQTAAGGLRIAARRGGPRAALVTLHGHSLQLSRRMSGSTPSIKTGSPALAVTGHAGSAKHSDVRIVAAVSEGRPLLLASGVGYRLGAVVGSVEKVPGLAEGRPGPAEQV